VGGGKRAQNNCRPLEPKSERIDIENRRDGLGVVNTVADPDYVTASASRERLELANEAGSLDLALDVADSIQAQDSLEKMLVHEMAVLSPPV
jgi:hypothetical protein